jgi:hypothetical protein
MNQYERVPGPDVRAGDLLAGELCARLAGIDVREIRDQLMPPSAGVALIAVPAGTGEVAGAEQSGNAGEERPAVFFDPGDELAGIPALAEVVEDANYWGGPYWGGPSAADPLDDPALIPGIRMMAARLPRHRGPRPACRDSAHPARRLEPR